MWSFTTIHLQLFYLLYHWFGSKSFRIASSDVVRIHFLFIHFFILNFIDFNLFFKIRRFPFDWKNPLGFLLATSLEFVMLFFSSRYLACFLILGFGMFMYGLSFAKDMIAELHSINKWAKAKKSETNILKRLIEIVIMHTDMKRWNEAVSLIKNSFWKEEKQKS